MGSAERASGACRSWPFHWVWDREGGWEVLIGRVGRVGPVLELDGHVLFP